MFKIIMIIVKICVAMILSIFLGSVFYGIYFARCIELGKNPVKLEWLMTNEDYEELEKFAVATAEMIEKH